MTQEEKAKRYDEALERAKKLYEQGTITESLSYVFPELKESEDEKIRKEITSILRNAYWTSNKDRFNELVAWLEKQGEQKQDPCDNCKDVMLNCHNFPCVKKRAFKQGKSVFEVINEENVDNANKVEQNPAWSEEDERQWNNIYDVLDGRFELSEDGYKNAANWIKSLRPQYIWHPSDEQIKALEHFVRGIWESCYDSPYENNAKLLYSLLEQLKKLK